MRKSLLLSLTAIGSLVLVMPGGYCAEEKDEDIYSHECTSWMVFRDLTQNGTNLLHKNRDAVSKTVIPLQSKPEVRRRWIGLGDIGKSQGHVLMGINASGLAAVINAGEIATDRKAPHAKLGTSAILEKCLTECDTAEQAAKLIEEIVNSGLSSHAPKGQIYLLMDTQAAYVVEMTTKHVSALRYDHGYAFRANIWHNPGMASVADNPFGNWLNSCNREYMVIRDFNKILRAQKKITVPDMLAISRDTKTPEGSPEHRTICYKSTNSASTLEINCAYPDVLSTGYFLIGPPRHTICVPVPICVKEFHPCMTASGWSAAAWKRLKQHGFAAELPDAWKALESRTLAQYREAQSQAEKLLQAGKRQDAVDLLNRTAWEIWEKAARLMQVEKVDSADAGASADNSANGI